MKTLISVVAILASVAVSSQTSAQVAAPASTATTRKQGPEASVDRWLSTPTEIALTPDQRRRMDSIRFAYAADAKKGVAEERGKGDVAVVVKMAQLASLYRLVVRDALMPAQQAIFDKNLAVDGKRP